MGPTGCLPLLLSRIFFKSFFAIVGQFWWIFWRLDSKNGFNFCRVDYLSDNTILWSTLYFCLLPHREPLHRVSWQCRKRLGATLATYRAAFLSLVLLNHINQDKKEKKKTSGLLGDLFCGTDGSNNAQKQTGSGSSLLQYHSRTFTPVNSISERGTIIHNRGEHTFVKWLKFS